MGGEMVNMEIQEEMKELHKFMVRICSEVDHEEMKVYEMNKELKIMKMLVLPMGMTGYLT